MSSKKNTDSTPTLTQVKTFKLAPLSMGSSSGGKDSEGTSPTLPKKKKLPSNKVVPIIHEKKNKTNTKEKQPQRTQNSTQSPSESKNSTQSASPKTHPSSKQQQQQKTEEKSSINNNLATIEKKMVKDKLHKTVLMQKPNFSVSASGFDSQMVAANEVGRAVDLSVRLLRISNLKEESHSYYCEFLLFLMWKDPNLIGKKQSEINWGNEKDPKGEKVKAWRPRMTVVNMISAVDDYFSPRAESCPILIGKNTGQVLFVQKINGTINNRFDLHLFPFDLQCLTLVFRSKDSFDKVYIRQMTNPRFSTTVSKSFASSLSHWNVSKYAYEEAQIDNHSLNRPYAVYKITVFAERRPQYYVKKMFLVVLITTLMSFLGFFTPLADIGSRLEFLVSILLTNIAFSFSVNQELPKIGYYTMLDKFFQPGTFAPFLAGLGTAGAYYFEGSQYEMCDRKTGASLNTGDVYDTGDDVTSFDDISCVNHVYIDTWVFRSLLLSYLMFWGYYYMQYHKIYNTNKAYLKNAFDSWSQRLATQGVEKKKRKEERHDRYEVKEMGNNKVLLRFFKDGLHF